MVERMLSTTTPKDVISFVLSCVRKEVFVLGNTFLLKSSTAAAHPTYFPRTPNFNYVFLLSRSTLSGGYFVG